MSSAHNPQTDGQTEAANRVVEMILRCLIHQHQQTTHWEQYLSMVEFVVNNSPSQSTGFTLGGCQSVRGLADGWPKNGVFSPLLADFGGLLGDFLAHLADFCGLARVGRRTKAD